MIQNNYHAIKQDVQDIVDLQMEQVSNTDSMKGFLVKKDQMLYPFIKAYWRLSLITK